MKTFFFALFTLCAFIASPVQAQNTTSYAAPQAIKWLTSYDEAVATSKASSKPILVLFTGTNWCPACMMLERHVLNHPEFAQAVASKFVFLKAEFPSPNASTSPYKSLLDRYQINEFPTIVVLDNAGNRLYVVRYRDGNPQTYVQDLLRHYPSA